jgi:hypothetical protein
LPPIIVRKASIEKPLSRASPGMPCPSTRNTRTIAAKAAAFTAALIIAVTGVGAPSYTSGVHMWNGTAAILKPNPTPTSARPQ